MIWRCVDRSAPEKEPSISIRDQFAEGLSLPFTDGRGFGHGIMYAVGFEPSGDGRGGGWEHGNEWGGSLVWGNR